MSKINKSLRELIIQYQDNDVISSIEKEYNKETHELLPLNMCKFNTFSKHQFFLDKALKDLTESISKNGIVNPILVRPSQKEGEYEVVSGYKRFFVAKKLHLKEIPCFIANISDELLIYMVLSRGHKKLHDNILNKTYTYQIITKEYHIPRKDIALVSKQSISQVNNILRLDNLDEEVKIALKKEKISFGQARVLIGLDDQTQKEYLHLILSEKLSVREIENLVKKVKNPHPYQDSIGSISSKINGRIRLTGKNVTFSFSTKEELDNFMKKLSERI